MRGGRDADKGAPLKCCTVTSRPSVQRPVHRHESRQNSQANEQLISGGHIGKADIPRRRGEASPKKETGTDTWSKVDGLEGGEEIRGWRGARVRNFSRMMDLGP